MSKKPYNSAQLVENRVGEKVQDFIASSQKSLFLSLFPKTFIQTFILVLLVYLGYPNKQISIVTGFCTKTVKEKRKFVEEGNFLHIFRRKKGVGRKKKCAGFIDQITKNLDSKDYRSVRQIASMIMSLIKEKISLTSVKSLLKNLGYKYLKSGSLPAKADPEKQRKFYDEKLHPLMEEAKQNKIFLFFLDAVHLIYGKDHLCGIWAKFRRFLRTYSGRKRYNVLGALNFVTKVVHTVTNDEYITATQVCEMLEKLAETYIGIPIHIILDNARYQHCKLVMEKAKDLGIHLEFLPAYSPNLNLIERFWKFLRKELGIELFEDFSKFCDAIDKAIASSYTEKKDSLDKLIGEKVQLFDDLIPRSEISGEESSKKYQ